MIHTEHKHWYQHVQLYYNDAHHDNITKQYIQTYCKILFKNLVSPEKNSNIMVEQSLER